MKFISLFSGIGGFDYGVMLAGHECVGYVEIDKYAHQAFEILHDPDRRLWNAYDIRSVSDESIRELGERNGGGIQLIVGGFPCQSFSIAGKRQGFADTTRGTLFFEIVRFASILRPQYLLLENVEGLLNHEEGRTFEIVLGTLDELGYDCEWQVHNSNAYVPQNRVRVFIVGHSRKQRTRKVFPFGRENEKSIEVVGRIEAKGDDYIRRVYGVGGLSPCLPTMQGGGQEPKILIDDQGRTKKKNELLSICPTLRAQSKGNEPKILVAGQMDSDTGGTGKVYDPDGIAPTQLAQHGNAVTKVVVLGNTNPSGNGMNGNVFDTEGLAPTLTTNKGEGIKVLQRMFAGKYSVNTDMTGILQAARVDKVPMVVEPRAVIDPERTEKTMNGRRFKEPGEPMFTLTAQDRHGIAVQCVNPRKEDGTQTYQQDRVYDDGGIMPALSSQLSGRFNIRNGYRIRKLTPLECFRLQSYPDEWFIRLKLYQNPEYIDRIDAGENDITAQILKLVDGLAKEGISDSQLYKMAGNGVTSIVAFEIARRMEGI